MNAVVENKSEQAVEESEIVANYDKYHSNETMIFRFKKDKMGNKRPNVELKAPVPSVEGIKEILKTGGKELELLLEACSDVVRGQIASWVAATPTASQETFPAQEFSWGKIANMPKQDRRSVTISEEDWEAFATDYVEVMSKVSNKTPEQLAAHIKVYMAKFSMFKTDKNVLGQMQQQLAIYMENTKSEEFSEILEVLLRRLENYLAADDTAALAASL